jgi:hypothetical protein
MRVLLRHRSSTPNPDGRARSAQRLRRLARGQAPLRMNVPPLSRRTLSNGRRLRVWRRMCRRRCTPLRAPKFTLPPGLRSMLRRRRCMPPRGRRCMLPGPRLRRGPKYMLPRRWCMPPHGPRSIRRHTRSCTRLRARWCTRPRARRPTPLCTPHHVPRRTRRHTPPRILRHTRHHIRSRRRSSVARQGNRAKRESRPGAYTNPRKQ